MATNDDHHDLGELTITFGERAWALWTAARDALRENNPDELARLLAAVRSGRTHITLTAILSSDSMRLVIRIAGEWDGERTLLEVLPPELRRELVN